MHDEFELRCGFAPGRGGQLLWVDTLPRTEARALVLFVHAFAEEIAKSRHLVAQTARALAARGVVVRCLDLHGCGDSAGDLASASWEVWLDDLHDQVHALEREHGLTCHLWAQRGGALVADALLERLDRRARSLLLWQPVLRGRALVTEFLRLRTAASMMAGGERETTDDLRALLEREGVLEVAGYAIGRDIIDGFEQRRLTFAGDLSLSVEWFDVTSNPERDLPPAARKQIEGCAERGVPVRVHRVEGPPFWGSGELQACPEIVAATARVGAELSG